jgi:hypothetical protein
MAMAAAAAEGLRLALLLQRCLLRRRLSGSLQMC